MKRETILRRSAKISKKKKKKEKGKYKFKRNKR